MTDASMVDLSKKYYAVHVQVSNFLNGIHYIPFADEDIKQMRQEYERDSSGYWFYNGDCLRIHMVQYLKRKFGYDIRTDADFSLLMHGDFEPVDMAFIINHPCGEDGGMIFWYDEETPIYKY